MPAPQFHRIHRTGWLRAAVLGANDGIVSTASLIAGVAAAQGSHGAILTAGLAGLVAGSLSMAAGEYISVKSQSDIESADLKLEQYSLNRRTSCANWRVYTLIVAWRPISPCRWPRR
jgi:VIT1/CCC1 family predicted Fe2+/Mn2+ transporter